MCVYCILIQLLAFPNGSMVTLKTRLEDRPFHKTLKDSAGQDVVGRDVTGMPSGQNSCGPDSDGQILVGKKGRSKEANLGLCPLL